MVEGTVLVAKWIDINSFSNFWFELFGYVKTKGDRSTVPSWQ